MATPPKQRPLLFLISTAAIFTFAASYLAGLLVDKGPCFQVSEMLGLKKPASPED